MYNEDWLLLSEVFCYEYIVVESDKLLSGLVVPHIV